MRVLFGTRSDGADAYFRAVAPASVMRYNGYDVDARTPMVNDADDYDVLILQRHADPVAELIMREFQDRGKPVIYDCDDWLFGIPPSWDCYGQYYHRGQMAPTSTLLHHERLLKRADAVTCTTRALQEKLAPYNSLVFELPNCVLWGDWDVVVPYGKEVDGPVVGWFGLPYHWDTWRLLAPVIEPAIVESGAWLAVLGFPEVVNCFSKRLAARTIVQPLVSWRDFATMRRMVASFDVGLCWMEDTEFNRCKSPLRALQYGAAGVPMIASPAVYGETLTREDGWFYANMAETPQEVAWAIGELLADEFTLEAAKSRAQLWQSRVWKEHTYETQWHLWTHVIQDQVQA